MSSNNSEGGGILFVLALIAVFLYFIFLFVFALGAFLAVIFTILCLLAWNRPLTLFGYAITPREARAFVGRGILGMILLPLFATFSGWFFEFNIPDNLWFYLILGGYVLGSVGVEYEKAKQGDDGLISKESAIVPIALLPQAPVMALPSNRPRQELSPEDTGFEFATWDDEEGR
jgi:hypothetical protein